MPPCGKDQVSAPALLALRAAAAIAAIALRIIGVLARALGLALVKLCF